MTTQIITPDAIELLVQVSAAIKALNEEVRTLQAVIADMKLSTMEKALYSPKEAAKYLGIAEATLARYRSEGVIGERTPVPEYIKIGDSVKFPIWDMNSWIREIAPRFGGWKRKEGA